MPVSIPSCLLIFYALSSVLRAPLHEHKLASVAGATSCVFVVPRELLPPSETAC